MIISAEAAARPTVRLMLRHPAHVIAFRCRCRAGSRRAGNGRHAARLSDVLVLASYCAAPTLLAIIALGFAAGIWACGRTGHALGVADHGGIVWDEIIAFMLVLVFTPPGPVWQACAFLLFRLFDILKPPPIRYYDRKLKNGFGVMFDDLLAAFYTLMVLAAGKLLIAD